MKMVIFSSSVLENTSVYTIIKKSGKAVKNMLNKYTRWPTEDLKTPDGPSQHNAETLFSLYTPNVWSQSFQRSPLCPEFSKAAILSDL